MDRLVIKWLGYPAGDKLVTSSSVGNEKNSVLISVLLFTKRFVRRETELVADAVGGAGGG